MHVIKKYSPRLTRAVTCSHRPSNLSDLRFSNSPTAVCLTLVCCDLLGSGADEFLRSNYLSRVPYLFQEVGLGLRRFRTAE